MGEYDVRKKCKRNPTMSNMTEQVEESFQDRMEKDILPSQMFLFHPELDMMTNVIKLANYITDKIWLLIVLEDE